MAISHKTIFLGSELPNVSLDDEGNIHVPEGEAVVANAPLRNHRDRPVTYDLATTRWMDAVESIRSGEVDIIDLYATLASVDDIPKLANACRGGYGPKSRVGIKLTATAKPMSTVLPNRKKKGSPLEVREGSYVYIRLEADA